MADLASRFTSVVLSALGWPRRPPPLDMMLFYRAEVKATSADGSTVDVQPEDTRISAHQGVPLRSPFPACSVTVKPGSVVLIGWEHGDPSRVYAAPIFEGSGGVTKLVIRADQVHLADEAGSNFVALANLVDAELTKISTTLASLTGGVSAPAKFLTPYTQGQTGATKTKAV